ncbi:Uncharacterized protein Adt_25400 [Abeliophyllum distichum]|uniref:Uncharacterized protein n=1 Tax=Abeliophyllum distichum TaxID=126358 RepID=A0ABD1SGM7_9LAMI
MKILFKRTSHFCCIAALFLACLVCRVKRADSLSISAAAPSSEPRCNATIYECVAHDDGEFLMESEISRRVLAAKSISYNGLMKQKPFCNRDSYGNCIGPESKNHKERPCNYQNLCAKE